MHGNCLKYMYEAIFKRGKTTLQWARLAEPSSFLRPDYIVTFAASYVLIQMKHQVFPYLVLLISVMNIIYYRY